MPGAVPLVLTAADPASRHAGVDLFPEAECRRLGRVELRPRVPFGGPLFALLAAVPPGACVGLVVPVRWRGAAGLAGPSAPGATAAAAPAHGAPAPGALLAVADHVNLELRGPLTGRWPAGVPRTFPPLAGVYQPALVRARGGPRVYSSGVIVAGVADAARLTPFEAGAVREGGFFAVSDSLVPAAIVAAYYGLTVAACGVVRADDNDEE
jgi:hypothetical protein